MGARYQPYPEYVPSNTDWLGNVPKNWKMLQIGRLFRRTKRTGFIDKELLSVYRDYGVIPKASRDDNNNKPSEDLSPYQLVKVDDLVMNKMKTWQGSIAMSEHEGIVSPAYFVYQPLDNLFDVAYPKYIHYLLRNPMYVSQYLRQSKGIRVNQWDLDPDEFQRIELLLPSKDEQLRIFQFLDHETAKIDTLIDKQQQLIKLLKEKRQAFISHAVTKGLNPDVPMKDSGVEWLGEVPEHWEVTRLKHLVFESTSGPYGSSLTKSMYTTSGIRVYGQQQVIPDDFAFGDYYISEEKFKEMTRYEVFPRDILISVMGTVGKVAVVPENIERGIINPRLVRYRVIENKVSPYFVKESILSDTSQSQLLFFAQGSTMDGLNMKIIGDLPIPYPSLEEQEEILAAIWQQNEEFNNLILKAQNIVGLLQERRAALISAAVTGKIDVRGWHR